MLIKEVMSPTPACCKPTDKLDTVAKMMLERHCGEIPVCDGTKLVGVVTDRDITCRAVATGLVPMDVPASEVMTKYVYTVREDAKLDEAIQLMEEKLVRRLPVVNESGKVIGIVSEADLIAKVPTMKIARLLKTFSKRTRKPQFVEV